MDLYRAIRDLSDVKEDSSSTPQDIQTSEENLRKAIDNITYVSEAAYLARMNWWTVEYGLVGSIDDPKIYGAGLLSSVSESQNCLTDKVKKIPFSLDCINTSYDITEPQPQLFVTSDFRELSVVLEQMVNKMAFRIGGLIGLQKAKEAQTVCTAEYESKIQISGILTNIIEDKEGKPAYLQYTGPTQLSRFGNQLKGHGGDYHKEGFGSPVGKVKGLNKPISDFNDDDITNINLYEEESVSIEFDSGVKVAGKVDHIIQDNGRFLIISFENCTVKHGETILFLPEWGMFDMTCGGYIKSVYGGPADFDHYQEFLPEDSPIIEEMSSKVNLSDSKTTLNKLYSKVREYREKNTIDYKSLYKLYETVRSTNPDDWLLAMEILELITEENSAQKIQSYLQSRYQNGSDLNHVIERGLELA
jgi:phenylalanine-4-hydroxylase